MRSYSRIITHSGPFHADDVLAVAILVDLQPTARVVRSRDIALLEEGVRDPETVMVDVGWDFDPERQNFDHHQQNFAQTRANGFPYASIGLVWASYGAAWLERVMGIEDAAERDFVFHAMDEDLIASVDAFDCGAVQGTHSVPQASGELRVPSVADVLGSYNPVWFDAPDFDRCFEDARREASALLRRQARRALAEVRFHQVVEAADDGSAVLVLSTAGPWRRFVKPHHLVVVFPAVGEDGWLVQAVGDPTSTQFPPPLRIKFPAAWRGLAREELQERTGLARVTFCHRAGFIGGASDRASALDFATLLVRDGERSS